MFLPAYHHRIVLLATGFQDPDRYLLFGRARLFLDRIELSGWHFGERYQQVIPLDEVCHIEWNAGVVAGPNVVFCLGEDRQFSLSLKHIHTWEHMLQERLQWSAPGRYRLAPQRPMLDLPLNDVVAYTSGMG